MKQIKTLFLAVMFIGASQFASAQTKVGHIDVSALVPNMPEMKAAESQLKKMQESYDDQYKKMTTDYQTKLEKYQKEAPTAGDALNQSRSLEMEQEGKRIQKFQQDAAAELQKKSEDLQKPILDKARTAIQKVARAKGIQYVLDSSVGSGVIMADGTDLLEDVKKELGSAPAVSTPANPKK